MLPSLRGDFYVAGGNGLAHTFDHKTFYLIHSSRVMSRVPVAACRVVGADFIGSLVRQLFPVASPPDRLVAPVNHLLPSYIWKRRQSFCGRYGASMGLSKRILLKARPGTLGFLTNFDAVVTAALKPVLFF